MRKPQHPPPPPPPMAAAAGSRQLVAVAEQQLARGHIDEAQQTLQRALRAAPDSPAVNTTLAVLAMFSGDAAKAVTFARHAARHAPADATVQFTLGRAHKAAGDLDAAVAAYQRAIGIRPGYAEAHVSLGIALKARGEIDAAIACYESAIAIDPRLAVAHTNLGAALALRAERAALPQQAAGDAGDAMVQAQLRAAELDPHDPEVQRNLGATLLRAGRTAEAAHAFNAALTLDPADLQSCLQLGQCLTALGDHALASAAYEKWLAKNELNAEVMRVLANGMTMLGDVDAGLDWARRSLEREPHALTAMQLGNSLLQARRFDEALRYCREGVEMAGHDPAIYPVLLMALNYCCEDPAPVFAGHAEIGARLAPMQRREPPRPRGPDERLRVGYVSGDFVRHSVAFFMAPLLRQHDSARFDIVCYHNSRRSDHVTERLKSFGHRWVDCAHLSDAEFDRRIRADGIDILVDLSGQTAQSRLMTFAQGPAPVQVGYLGYPTVSGVPAMDWRITDAAIDPGDMPAFASDRPLLLPRSMFCFEPGVAAPLADPPSLQGRPVTFGSFNNVAKITDRTLALWAAVLNAVPGSRLLLKAATVAQPSVRAGIEAFLAGHGVAAERLSLHARRMGDLEHMALYNEVDVALDTYPYNGATTSCEALWMGVPVVTRRGSTHTSRMGASILGAIGHDDWVAGDDESFVAIAAALAADAEGRRRWRHGAREQLGASALCDRVGFTRDFEAALITAWAARPTQPA